MSKRVGWGGMEVMDAEWRPLDVERADRAAEATVERHVCRAELVLARPSREALAMLEVKPDPLQSLAGVMRTVDYSAGERLYVDLSLAPTTPWQRRRIRRQLVQQADRQPSLFSAMLSNNRRQGGLFDPSRWYQNPSERMERNYEQQRLSSKVGGDSALFEPQLLIRAEAPSQARAKALVKAAETAFRQWSGQNYWRQYGFWIPGIAFFGTDTFRALRLWFDKRWSLGLHMPRKRSIVSGTEILALLKPPTKWCEADNVERSGGYIAQAPPSLPLYQRQAGTLPLGRTSDGRMVGVPALDTLFAYLPGRSRFGKTTLASNVFLHAVLVEGNGALFIDPAATAIRSMKDYLGAPGVAERVVEINIHGRGSQPGWNPLSMEGLGPEDLPDKLGAVVDAIAAVQGWNSQVNARAFNLTMQSVQVLLELALLLPPHLCPTVFQIPTLLTDKRWREAVLQHVPASLRSFWFNEFDSVKREGTPPVTNMIRTMRAYPALAALLGSSRSTFDMRRAMDQGQVVLLCPGTRNNQGRILANLMVYDLVRAAFSRHDRDERWCAAHRFWSFLDELQTYDGAVSGSIADIFEGTAKFGHSAYAMNQEPERLRDDTLQTLMANRSHIISTAVSHAAATKLLKGLHDAPTPDTLTQLPQYDYICDVTIGRQKPSPFLVHGVTVEELWGDLAQPELTPHLEEVMDRTFRRRPPDEVVAELEDLDARILAHLNDRRRGAVDAGDASELPPEPV